MKRDAGFLKLMKIKLKGMDIFEQNLQPTWHSVDKDTNKVRYRKQKGSWIGGIISIFFILCIVAFLLNKMLQMFMGYFCSYRFWGIISLEII